MRTAWWISHFLYDPASDGLHSSQSFITGWCNVGGWQEEAILPTVLKLKCKGVFDAEVVSPVIRATGSQVWKTENTLMCKLTHTDLI